MWCCNEQREVQAAARVRTQLNDLLSSLRFRCIIGLTLQQKPETLLEQLHNFPWYFPTFHGSKFICNWFAVFSLLEKIQFEEPNSSHKSLIDWKLVESMFEGIKNMSLESRFINYNPLSLHWEAKRREEISSALPGLARAAALIESRRHWEEKNEIEKKEKEKELSELRGKCYW